MPVLGEGLSLGCLHTTVLCYWAAFSIGVKLVSPCTLEGTMSGSGKWSVASMQQVITVNSIVNWTQLVISTADVCRVNLNNG